MAESPKPQAAVEPDEVLTPEEARERATQQERGQGASSVAGQLGGLAGELIARAIGASPKVGRGLGAAAAKIMDPRVRAKLGSAYDQLRKKR